MPGWPDSVERAGIRKRMDDRLRPEANPELLPGAWWLLAHGSSVPKLHAMEQGDICEAQIGAESNGHKVWVYVTGSARGNVAWWRAKLQVYGDTEERRIAESLTPYRSRDVAIAVGVQLERLDAALKQYNESKEKDNDQTGRKEAGG
jgi:hypothetical protein